MRATGLWQWPTGLRTEAVSHVTVSARSPTARAVGGGHWAGRSVGSGAYRLYLPDLFAPQAGSANGSSALCFGEDHVARNVTTSVYVTR